MSGTRQRRDTLNANETFTLKVQHVFVIKKKITGERKYLISRYETKVEALKRNKMSTIRHEIEQHLLCVHALSEEVSTFFSKSIQFQIPPHRQETRWQQ